MVGRGVSVGCGVGWSGGMLSLLEKVEITSGSPIVGLPIVKPRIAETGGVPT